MKRVAVIGASKNRDKFGNKALRAYQSQGYEVYPINPREESIEGLDCYPSVSEVQGELDIVSVYVAPEVLAEILPEIAAKGCRELWLNPGSESERVLARADELGLNSVQACSIVALGLSPASL